METPKLLINKSKRLSIGRHRLSDSKTVAKALDVGSVLNTPPSTRSNEIPTNDSKCRTPLTRRKTFIAEESPSQDYEYGNFSPTILASQDVRGEYQDVGWEWEEKVSKSKATACLEETKTKHYSESNVDRSKRKNIFPKEKCKSQDKVSATEKGDQGTDKGFYIFKKEIESIKKNNWRVDDDELDNSLKENLITKDKSKNIESSAKHPLEGKDTPADFSIFMSLKNNVPEFNKKADSEANESEFLKEAGISFSCFDDSDMDAMLLEASQNVEIKLTEKPELKNTAQKEADLAAELNFEEDYLNEIFLSIPENDLCTFSPNPSEINFKVKQTAKSLFTRHSSMPYVSPQRNINAMRSLNRHSSMSFDKSENNSATSSKTSITRDTSSGKTNQTLKESLFFNHCYLKTYDSPKSIFLNEEGIDLTSLRSDNDCTGSKRLCTKEEMEQKRLEAKKRQLISQQKRMTLHQQNGILKNKVNSSAPGSFSNNSLNFKSVKR